MALQPSLGACVAWLVTYMSVANGLSCRSVGDPVDWFVALKAAGQVRTPGTDYAYLDSDLASQRSGATVWARSEGLQASQNTPLSETLSPLYSQLGNVGYVMWNDEPPSSHNAPTSFDLAHAKGVLGFDTLGGFLLLHSTPKFPDSPADAAYGGIYTSQLQHAQSFACVSLAPAAVDQLAHLLQTTNLYIYAQQLPAGTTQAYANISLLVSQALPFEGATLDPKTKRLATNLATAGGQQLLIATHSSTGRGGQRTRLFEDMLEIELVSGMKVQTWSEGASNDLPSYCGPPDSTFESLNVEQIRVPGTGLAWPSRHAEDRDHSKWAVTFDGELTSRPGLFKAARSVKVVCLADQNRAKSQELRGGSAVCFRNERLWAAFTSIIARVDDCQEGAQQA